MIFSKFYLINNFPDNYPLYKKVWANIIFFFSGIVISPRKNLLTLKDLFRVRLKLRKGDIILAGNLRQTSSLLISGSVTHSAVYVKHRRFIHAIASGVEYTSLDHIYHTYDTLAILRLPKISNRRRIIRTAIKYAKSQLGKPYDFEFNKSESAYFCTKLVNDCFLHAGYDTKLKSIKPTRGLGSKILSKVTTAHKALLPKEFIKGNFEVVFLSHNLAIKNRKLIYKE